MDKRSSTENAVEFHVENLFSPSDITNAGCIEATLLYAVRFTVKRVAISYVLFHS